MNRRSITACALALAFVAMSGRVALAQERGQDRQPNANQGGQRPNAQPQGKTSFNDQDRQATRNWYSQHQKTAGAGWRKQDQLSPDMQSRLRPGQTLDPELRKHMHPIPSDLSRHYGPAPSGYRYAVIGGNVVMLDDKYGVHDVFSLTLQF